MLQRRAGKGWTTVKRESRRSDATELLPSSLRAGQTVRAVVEFGGQSFPLATKTLTVVRADRRSTSRRDDGRYRDAKPAKNSLGIVARLDAELARV